MTSNAIARMTENAPRQLPEDATQPLQAVAKPDQSPPDGRHHGWAGVAGSGELQGKLSASPQARPYRPGMARRPPVAALPGPHPGRHRQGPLCADSGGGLRPALTAAPRDAAGSCWPDGETALKPNKETTGYPRASI